MATAIITGASSGIGRATAEQLAARGFDLVLAARHPLPLAAVRSEIEKQFEQIAVLTVVTDVGVGGEVEALVAAAVDHFGGVDVLVNNAGFAPLQAIGALDFEELTRVFAVNAVGPAVAINAVWETMKTQGGGRIINLSSLATADPFPGFLAYAASKCALNSYARSIATEGAEFGIKGFAVAPGAVETPLLRALFDEKMIPASATLSALEVAEVVVECACGVRDEANGETFFLEKTVGG